MNYDYRAAIVKVLPKLQAMTDAAYPARILETRKTAPCLRLVDKWAVWLLNISILLLSTYHHHMFIDMLLCLYFRC